MKVIANESYEDFARALQKEIEEDCGVKFEGRIKNARDRKKIELKKNWELDEQFLDLWNRIKHKTEYKVQYDTKELIKRAGEAVKNMPAIPRPQIQRIKTETTFLRDEKNRLLEIGGDIKSSKELTIHDVKYDITDFEG